MPFQIFHLRYTTSAELFQELIRNVIIWETCCGGKSNEQRKVCCVVLIESLLADFCARETGSQMRCRCSYVLVIDVSVLQKVDLRCGIIILV